MRVTRSATPFGSLNPFGLYGFCSSRLLGIAVEAVIAGEAVPGQISSLYPSICPAVERAGSDEQP